MRSNRIIFILFILAASTAAMLSNTGCANIIPPEGGPRDSLPPQLVNANPDDSTTNFAGNRITFTFDEFVEVQNAQQELLVSPTPRSAPAVDWRLNTVTVRLRDTLERNTTYTIQFGNAIKDVNESNIKKNFTYTFSTGPYLDSLELRGKVILAETGKIDSTLIVMLHTNPDDSAVQRERPRYVTKLDRNGNFVFRNLPPRTYYLYALKDESNARRYIDDRQLFAFADEPVSISDSVLPVTLYAYSIKPAPAATVTPSFVGGRIRGGVPAVDRRLKFTTNLINEQQDLLSKFTMSFEQPLRSFDSSKIELRVDSAFSPASEHRFELDSTRRMLQLIHQWQENRLYHILMDKDFAEDSSGRKLLRNDTISFTTKKSGDYGQVRIRFRNLQLERNPVLLFVLNDQVVQSFPLASTEFLQSLFLPGDYDLRILFDDNKNGKWDPGDFFGQRKQPEIVKPIDRKLNIRARFENEFEIAL